MQALTVAVQLFKKDMRRIESHGIINKAKQQYHVLRPNPDIAPNGTFFHSGQFLTRFHAMFGLNVGLIKIIHI